MEKPPSRKLVFATVTFYLVAALIMVFANKWVLNAVQAPLTFLLLQLLIAVALLHLSAALGYFVLPILKLEACRALVPLVAINVVGLTFNTFCLQYVDASFYQVARGLVLPFTVCASYLFLGTRSSPRVYLAVVVVCFGFFYGVSSERLTVSHVGVALGVFSSMTTSVHAIVVKRSLGVVPSAIDLAYYSNLMSSAALFPCMLFSGEFGVLMTMVEERGEGLQTFFMGTMVTGVFGFLICVAGFLSIKVTSPVTHMVSSAVRGVLQTGLAAILFGDIITSGRLGGIFFILIGSLYYTWTKDQEMQAAKTQYKALATDPSRPPAHQAYPMAEVGRRNSATGRSDGHVFDLDGEVMDDDEREMAAAAKAVGGK